MLSAPRIVVPRLGLQPITFRPHARIHLTDYGIEWARATFERSGRRRTGLSPIAGGAGQMSSWAEQQVLNHLNGQDNASWANLSPVYMALCTVVPTSSSTGSTITEATYGGYARTSLAHGAWNAAAGSGPASASNSGTITAPDCASGSSTLIAMCTCTAVTAGNVIFWSGIPSVLISTVQTPPTVPPGAFSQALS